MSKKGATNQQARSAWERSGKDNYNPMTPTSRDKDNGPSADDFNSDINMNGTNWHTAEDL